MTAEQFAYWLQGYAELNDAPPSTEQWQMIREHLALVFTKVTPNWRYPPVYLGGGAILASGDGETRLVC
jgi:hypothetical protein